MNRITAGVMGAALCVCALVASNTTQVWAQTDCDSVLQPANDLLQQAETAIGRQDLNAAGGAYDAALTKLAAVPWTPAVADCDANRYRLEKLISTARSLVIGIKLNRVEPADARKLDTGLLGQIYSLTGAKTPSTVYGTRVTISDAKSGGDSENVTNSGPKTTAPSQYFHDRYHDLYDRFAAYVTATWDIERERRAALHFPTPGNCLKPNLESEPAVKDASATTELAMGIGHHHLSYGTYTATADVQLAADGAVQSVRLVQSSGDRDFDDAFMQDVQKTKYLPAVADCKQVPSVYIFTTTEKIGD